MYCNLTLTDQLSVYSSICSFILHFFASTFYRSFMFLPSFLSFRSLHFSLFFFLSFFQPTFLKKEVRLKRLLTRVLIVSPAPSPPQLQREPCLDKLQANRLSCTQIYPQNYYLVLTVHKDLLLFEIIFFFFRY
jgi:hypothetical protein